jgi:putative oxidoreductase
MASHLGRKWCWIACHFIRHNSGVESEHVQRFANHSTRTDVALLALRIASGVAFLYHGAAILFGMFGGPGPERFAIDHRFPVVLGYLVGLAQVASAIAVLAGVFVRFAAAALIVVMLGAIFLVHLPHGFDVSNGGIEYALTQLLIALALLLMGAGSYSLASRFPARLKGL